MLPVTVPSGNVGHELVQLLSQQSEALSRRVASRHWHSAAQQIDALLRKWLARSAMVERAAADLVGAAGSVPRPRLRNKVRMVGVRCKATENHVAMLSSTSGEAKI